MPSLLLFVMLLSGAAQALESRWWSVTAGAEATRYADENPYLFHDAEGWTRSLYGSAGAGAHWLGAAGLTDQRIRQESWNFHALKRSLWLGGALSPAWGLELMGVSSSTRMSWPAPGSSSVGRHGWVAGGGLIWCPAPAATAPLMVNARAMRLRQAAPSAPEGIPLTAELNLARRAERGNQRLGLLASRVGGVTKVAGLARVTFADGRLGAHVDLLLGHQDQWFDVERLVVHDGLHELRSLLGAGLSWRVWRGLGVEGSAGWEELQGFESRWLFLGLKWTHQVWAASD